MDGQNYLGGSRLLEATRALKFYKKLKKRAGIKRINSNPVGDVATMVQSNYRGHVVRRRTKRMLKMAKHRKRVVQEMMMTERSYNSSIGKLVESCIVPLKWQCKHSTNPVSCRN